MMDEKNNQQLRETMKLSLEEIRRHSMNGEMNETIIADGTVMKGSIASECPITVSGKVEGDLAAPSLTITPQGSVHGQVLVERLVSQGEISGDIEAKEVNLSGKVRDKTAIKARSLEVKLDAQDPDRLTITFGEVSLEVGESKDVSSSEEDEN